eukprot:TRINITY_DN37670_c0_g2_i1.p1 TRINITY_DN37670_c0_g2~~TRINITY_DN37670_c0_g2_i1.p1  ORF type:complete len:406 (-),score=68.17 TRINITY_DN37670_c0_g2_i1:646-1863(-)
MAATAKAYGFTDGEQVVFSDIAAAGGCAVSSRSSATAGMQDAACTEVGRTAAEQHSDSDEAPLVRRKEASAGPASPENRRASSVATLLLAAALYSSMGICFRVLYELPGPPTPAVLGLGRQILTVAVFVPILCCSRSAGTATASSAKAFARSFWLAGAELAWWNLAMQGLLTVGVAFTTASRASFFCQMSVVITPVLAALGGQNVPLAMVPVCCLALVGIVLLGGDGVASGAAGTGGLVSWLMGFNRGDLFCLGGAVGWSFYIFRLAVWEKRRSSAANQPSALELQAAKTFLLTFGYLAWVVIDWLVVRECTLVSMWAGWSSVLAWLILLLSAIGPGAVADVLMQQGSAGVGAAATNVVLATDSLFAAVLAGLVLNERLGAKGLLGGACIFTAAVLAGVCERPQR